MSAVRRLLALCLFGFSGIFQAVSQVVPPSGFVPSAPAAVGGVSSPPVSVSPAGASVPAVPAMSGQPSAATATEPANQAAVISKEMLGTIAAMLTAGKATSKDPSGMKSSPLAEQAVDGVGHEWSIRSSEIVQGLLEAYLHKVSLHKGEKLCIERNIDSLAAGLAGAAEDAVSTLKKGLKPEGPMAKVSDMVPFLLDGAGKVMGMVKLGQRLMESCVLGDTVQTLNVTAQHLANIKYLQKRLVVNGVDIAESLTDSVLEWDRKEYRRFGYDIGTALRKMLLSNANHERHLPEGPAQDKAIEEATVGMVRGFLNEGDEVILTDAAEPSVHITLDLHQCLIDNKNFFQSVWTSAWTLVASMAANKEQYDLAEEFGASETAATQPGEAVAEVALTLMQIPLALKKCNLNNDTEAMLLEAFHTLNSTHIEFKFGDAPTDSSVVARDIKRKLARAVDDWKDYDFKGFGSELGDILRDILLLAFPTKYHVDPSGFIRRTLMTPKVVSSTADDNSQHPHLQNIAFVAALGALIAAVPVAVWRVRQQAYTQVSETQLQEDDEEVFLDLEEIFVA